MSHSRTYPPHFDFFGPGQAVTVSRQALFDRVAEVAGRFVDAAHAAYLAEKIVLAEVMNVPTHGLHYFLHSLRPLLAEGRINDAEIEIAGPIVRSEGKGGVAFLHLHDCLERASTVAQTHGIAVVAMRKPGKVGALRVYCRELMDRGQLVVLMKNTARTVGTPETRQPVFGTNPLCIGLPDTDFIYDASMSTTATNKMRLARKTGKHFDDPIGVDANMQPTCDADATLAKDGYLLPFSFGPYWFKSFFLGIAIEGIAALVGGHTGSRVGEHKGERLYSSEGMFGLVLDRSGFPHYDDYKNEIGLLLREVEGLGLKIPGTYGETGELRVFQPDWDQLAAL